MGRNGTFLKNTFIIFIGKFLTQFMSLLLIPLYTHYLDTSDYGYIDLAQTYIMLLIPIGCLRIDTALFRFLMDSREDPKKKNKVIFNGFIVLLVGCLLILISSIVLSGIIEIKYFFEIIINIFILIISSVLLQILRGNGKTKEYSICSVIVGLLTLIINFLLIVVFDFGAISILYSSSVANLVGIIYMFFIIGPINTSLKDNYDKDVMTDMVKYSLPMIPDYLSGWIVNVSDRSIISTFLNHAMNGIYTVSCKFSNILNSIYNIYNISWQENVILHYKDKDRDEYFSRLFDRTLNVFSALGLLILIFLPLVYNIIIGKEYLESYKYIPILIYANFWRVIVGLTMAFYVANKKTKDVAITTFVSAFINIIINLLMIKKFKIYAACISTLIAYFIMAIYRLIDCRKFIKIKMNKTNFMINTILYIIVSIVYYINKPILSILNALIIVIILLMINKKLLKKFYKTIFKRKGRI